MIVVLKTFLGLVCLTGASAAIGFSAPDRTDERARMISSIKAAAADVPALRDDPFFQAAVAVEKNLPREDFVPRAAKRQAYIGAPLEIGWQQTISDPYVMAIMTAAVQVHRGSRVLEIGTGSGYQAAILAELGAEVSTIEIVPQLARQAATALRRRGYRNVHARVGDGFAGWPERAPFDAVIVTAGSASVPTPLLDQLRIGGRLVMPIGPSTATERLEVFTKQADGNVVACSLGWAMFVPLTGRGYAPDRPGVGDHGKPWCFGASVT
ncbi:protein-L-isoaspartate(D-aspartate) O-methyltransferase [Sphingomonas sanguinis]|uniref:protein-L-isoaspartate(D-aspartate) O-methyltransferase n=1 Tax=Sphingomonas sanguinis TaxID=33051 RepID=UPI0030183FA6